ncbi:MULTISPECIES: YxeA family protein [Lacticaseibacillus]|uniref:YxeA family protein n=2 Tax=Lacticaseibacillus TaxID=2759736 RepID=A0ABW4CHW1_9LACO|nr:MULTISPECIES: YxeA family protein [Lacticaseibacillus]
MKKFLIGLVVLVVLVFGGLKLYSVTNYGGTSYYTQITTDGKKITQKDDNGATYTDYEYTLVGYDENGAPRTLNFNANKARPLKKNAYLKLVYNEKKGVTSWEAVDDVDVPKQAMTKLEQE